MDKKIYVKTPNGLRFHGEIKGECFTRIVKEKDRMKIFDAWSIHPDAFDEIKKEGVKFLMYLCGNDNYTISLEDAEKKGFEREFAGGLTRYIQIKYWQFLKEGKSPLDNKTK